MMAIATSQTDAMALRPIDATGFAAIVVPEALGRVPRLEWIAISALVVDPQYQREISNVGRKNVRRIAAEFNWSMFTPVIVAPVGSSRFAIVDGQHRTTAAALCGVEKAPCAIIEAVRGEQAAAFRAINGRTTRVHKVQLFHASVAAGEPEARQVVEVCAKAGVKVARSLGRLQNRTTFSVGTLGKAIERHGEAIVVLALRLIVHSGDGRAEELGQTVIGAVIEVIARRPDWRAAEKQLFAAFEEFCLEDMARAAAVAAARVRGSSARDQMERELTKRLAAVMPKGSA